MFYVGLTFSQLLLITGIVLLLQSYIIGGPFVLLGALVSYVFFAFYTKRKKKGKKKDKTENGDICDCFDCVDIPFPKKLDCDCDCAPDCTP